MTEIIDCYFWKKNLDFKNKPKFEYQEIDKSIKLKKPILDINILDTIISELKKDREYLQNLDTSDLFNIIKQIADLWMDPNYELRKKATELLPIVTGFSKEMIESLTYRFINFLEKRDLPLFKKLNPEEFRDFNNLGDGLVKAFGKGKIEYSNYQPKIIGHICAGNIPGIAVFEMLIDKFLGAATWIKTSSDEPIFGVLYAKSIEEVDEKLADTIAIIPFKSGNNVLEEFLFSNSDIVRATGGERARANLTRLAKKCKIPLAGHWHKLSFITISREYLKRGIANKIAELVSLDVSAWDQQGCFSPQEIFVETGGEIKPRRFAELLAKEMMKTTQAFPKGKRSGNINVLDAYHRYFKKKIVGEPIEIFSPESHDWLVVYDESNHNFEPSDLFRTIKVKPVTNIMDVVEIVKPIKDFLQTIGVAIPLDRLIPFADAMGRLGASNIRVVGSMTFPKPWEPWDGKMPIEELLERSDIRWTSINTRDIDQEIEKLLKIKKEIIDKKD
jgi:hypothetical protein